MTTGLPATDILASRLAAIETNKDTIDSVVEGEELVMVRTTGNETGVAMNPDADLPGVIGESAYDIARRGVESTSVAERAIGVATLNAIDAATDTIQDLDPFRALEPTVERVAMVGFFGPVFKHLEAATVDVFELNPEAVDPPADKVEGFDLSIYPPEKASREFPKADVVFITGSTLVWGGLESYLEAATADQTVVVVGASCSFQPTPFFDAGVSVVAGARPEAPEKLETAITDDKSESDLHEVGLKKWAAVNPAVEALPGLDIDISSSHAGPAP